MEIAAWGIAMVYLLVIAAGAVGALLVLMWLFGEAPGEGRRTGQETAEDSLSIDRSGAVSTTPPAASVEPESSEGKAA